MGHYQKELFIPYLKEKQWLAYDGFVVSVVIVYVVVVVVGVGGGDVIVVVVVDVVVVVVIVVGDGGGVGGGCRPVGDKENWCSLGSTQVSVVLTSFDFFKRDALSHNLCRIRLSTLAIGKMFSMIM